MSAAIFVSTKVLCDPPGDVWVRLLVSTPRALSWRPEKDVAVKIAEPWHVEYGYYTLYIYVCICKYVYMYRHMYTYIHTYMHTCIHAYMHTCIHAYMHTYIHTYIYIYIDIYLYTYLYVYLVYWWYCVGQHQLLLWNSWWLMFFLPGRPWLFRSAHIESEQYFHLDYAAKLCVPWIRWRGFSYFFQKEIVYI